jgi:hypothetical protein
VLLVDERRCVEVENGVSEMMRTRNKAEAHINALYLVLEFLSQSTNDRMTELRTEIRFQKCKNKKIINPN